MNRLRPFAVLNQPHTGVQPDPWVAIELADTDRGFLPNRLSTDQRDAIAEPEGLTIYNTDTKTHELFDGASWQQMAKSGGGGAASLAFQIGSRLVSGDAFTMSGYGVGNTITPNKSGNLVVIFGGTVICTAAAQGLVSHANWGTGTPPNTGDAEIGTIMLEQVFEPPGGNETVPFAMTFLITSAALGVALWVDIALRCEIAAFGAGVQSASDCVIFEI